MQNIISNPNVLIVVVVYSLRSFSNINQVLHFIKLHTDSNIHTYHHFVLYDSHCIIITLSYWSYLSQLYLIYTHLIIIIYRRRDLLPIYFFNPIIYTLESTFPSIHCNHLIMSIVIKYKCVDILTS